MFGKRNEFTFDVRGGKKRKGSTSSNFAQKQQREQDRLHKNGKEGQDSFSFCEDEEEELQRREGKHKEKDGESNQTSETAKREAKKQKQ